jgi:pimeloyl-ACP methyl ester carboxylesterase
MTSARPAVLVPGHWLGAWAWEETVRRLEVAKVRALPITLPGLDGPTTNRAAVRFCDHVGAVLDALDGFDTEPVLVAHSGAGAVATAALDAAPDQIFRVVYVESGPVADGTIFQPDLDTDIVELALPPLEELEAGGASLEGLGARQLRTFEERAVPHPAGPLREPVLLTNPLRNRVPATMVCCSIPSTTVRELAAAGVPAFGPTAELETVDYVDLPTGHWPMWSRPAALASVLARCCDA